MHCLFYLACIFLALQAALAVPTTLSPRADQTANAKGQSDQKCLYFGCGGYGLGYGGYGLGYGGYGLGYGGYGLGYGGYGLGYGGYGLGYGAAYLNPYSMYYTPGWGLWKKDAPAAGQNTSPELPSGCPCELTWVFQPSSPITLIFMLMGQWIDMLAMDQAKDVGWDATICGESLPYTRHNPVKHSKKNSQVTLGASG
ncbi:hypothetical protein VP01_328g2 [Puccinia sorghi]|uniref:Uncharacterized protein n=1 Tax=Puccinia sorghi TaxID=27349 RepID=A0A0L6UZH1_9BASI|nr:hypothetical protein VP01_328g2 [Puccinia sorghi]